MSLGQSLNIAVNSMQNNQYALTVVSHNIANINTEGYTKQRVDFQESRLGYPSGVIPTIKSLDGAKISDLTDYMDTAALNNVIDSNSDAQYYNTLSDALDGLEDVIDALGDDGLNSLMNDFYTAAADLEKYPDDISIRQVYTSAAQNVCDKFNEISKTLDSKQEDMVDDVTTEVDVVNSLLEKFATQNEQYISSGQNTQVLGDMYSTLQDLSQYIDITTDTNSNGSMNLYIGTTKVVQAGSLNYTLKTNTSGDSGNPVDLYLQSTTDDTLKITKGINEAIKGGTIGAQVSFLNGNVDNIYNYSDLQNYIDEAANNFATNLNDIQTYDDGNKFAASLTTDADGNTILEKATTPMFSTLDGTTTFSAKNITVNSDISNDVSKIAAARIDLSKYTDADGNISDDWKNAIGNSDNATVITDLQNQKICSYNGINCTMSQFLTNLASKLGLDGNDIASKADTYQTIADDAQTSYTDATGVNLDEEIADMLKYQRAYEASAKVFSTVNDIYDMIFSMV